MAEFLDYCCYLDALPGAAAADAVARATADAHLGDLLPRRLRQLSGGQRRRAFVAGAAIASPRVLVLDEPTVGIDAEHRDLLRAQLRRSASRALVVLSSHSAEDFESLADHIVFLRRGRLVYSGDRAGFLAAGQDLSGPTAPSSVGERALIALAAADPAPGT